MRQAGGAKHQRSRDKKYVLSAALPFSVRRKAKFYTEIVEPVQQVTAAILRCQL